MELFKVNMILLFALVYFTPCEGFVNASEEVILNDRPIIGILAQEQSLYLHSKFPKENYTSYIASSYVKAVEGAGARVVPIMIGKERNYYKDIMSKVNGVVFPGGATFFNQSNGYADAGQHIYELAQEMNDAGQYFPIFGVCLGFQLLIILASGRGEIENRGRCSSFENTAIEFIDDYRYTKMYKDAPEEVIYNLATKEITAHAHQFCIFDENMEAYNLTDNWRVTAYSYDENGLKNVATLEHKKYPFYATMFHPEKNAYEWKLSKRHNHSLEAVQTNRYFMDFFGRECRKSSHSFADEAEEHRYVIYNYEPVHTGVLGSAFHQHYFFEPKGTVSK